MNAPLEPAAELGVARFVLGLRAAGLAYFLEQARLERSPASFSACGFHAAGLRRYADEKIENLRAARRR